MVTLKEFRAWDRLIELGDRIHIRKFEGCYEVIHITEKTFFISCGKWRIQGRKSLELPHEEFKCHVGSPFKHLHEKANTINIEKVETIKDDLAKFYDWLLTLPDMGYIGDPDTVIEAYKEYLKNS